MATAADRKHAALHAKAHAAGDAAAIAAIPTPMVVGSPTTPLGNDFDLSKPLYFVNEGACGFAWITVRPGTASFARWLRKVGLSRKGYYGGEELWVRDYGQSMARKEAYAGAYAGVLREAGIKAYAGSRMD